MVYFILFNVQYQSSNNQQLELGIWWSIMHIYCIIYHFDFCVINIPAIFKMADLASSFTSFIFPEGFQPLDGSDVESETETLLKFGSTRQSILDYKCAPCPTFHKTLGLNPSLEFSQEVTVKMETGTSEEEGSPLTPTKPPIRLLALSPMTPTANLKVLISAASPDIRVLDTKRQKKALFNAIADHASYLQEQEEVIDVGVDSILEEVVEAGSFSQGEDGVDDGDKPMNRKSKSLGLLCQR